MRRTSCEWKYCKHDDVYVPNCDDDYVFGVKLRGEWKYCPLCGGKIKGAAITQTGGADEAQDTGRD